MKAIAAFLEKINSPLAVDTIDMPEDLYHGQVEVKVKYSGICGAQIGEISGAKGEDKYLPHLLGHEGSGIVMGVGPGVQTVKTGDHVVLHWRKGDGIDADCPKYKIFDKIIGGGSVTTFNQYAVVSENRVTAIPKNIPLPVASLLGCAVTTGLGLINNEAKLKMGQSILILGAGGVGLNIVQGAAMVSAGRIAAVDNSMEKGQMAEKFGATEFHILKGVFQAILNVKGLFDVVVDCTGLSCMIVYGLEKTAPGGKLILVGQPDWYKDISFPKFRQHYCGKTIMDSQGGLTNPTIDIPRYLKLYESGKLNLDDLITSTFSLVDVNQALVAMRAGVAGRILLEMPS